MKTLSFSFISLLSFLLFGSISVSAELGTTANFPYEEIPITSSAPSEDLPSLVSVGMVDFDDDSDTLLDTFLGIFGFNSTQYTGTTKALMYVKTIINLLLSLVSFVALGIILYSFYLMFFTEDTKGIETVKKNLKGVAIALVILGLSRFIVSFIFNLYNRISCPEGQTWSESDQQCMPSS